MPCQLLFAYFDQIWASISPCLTNIYGHNGQITTEQGTTHKVQINIHLDEVLTDQDLKDAVQVILVRDNLVIWCGGL